MALRSDDVKEIKARFYVLALVAFIGFFAVGTRLYGLQIQRGEEFTIKSEQNFVQRLRLTADRGLMYDAKGRLIVDNRPALDLYATPAFIPKGELEPSLRQMQRFLELSDEEHLQLLKRLRGARDLERFQAMLVRRDLTRDQIELIESERMLGHLDGFNVVDSGVRDYRYGKLLAHVTGYLNEIGPQEFEQRRSNGDRTYELGDLLGRRGLERSFEGFLRGKDGYERVVVDSKGRRQSEAHARELLGEDRRQPSQPGNNLVLSLDLDLQRAAQAAFTGLAGAVIAVEVNTGFVLAMYSAPAYDPNRVTGRISLKEKEQLDKDPLKPWINRAIQEHYPPGSTFKAYTALTALKHGRITPTTVLSCPGYYRYGGNTWRCFKDSGHGGLELHRSLVMSCDTFYYGLGAKLGVDALAETTRAFGFGRRSEIALDQEITGIVPDEAYHNLRHKREGGYKRAHAINTAVGQGDNAQTPLQVVMAYAAIANGGTLYRPQLVRRVEDAEGRVLKEFAPEVAGKLDFQEEHWAAVKSGLCGVVNEAGGTAYGRRQADLTVCGKTGTAQVAKLKQRVKDQSSIEYKLRDHAWFVGFAPGEAPEIAVVTLTENGGFGGMASSPTVMAVMRAQLKGEYPGAGSAYYLGDEDLVKRSAAANAKATISTSVEAP